MTPNVGSLLQGRTVMFSPTFTVVDAGPTALQAIVSGADKFVVRKRVQALADMLGKYDIPGCGPLNTTNDSLLVEFDPSLIEPAALKRLIRIVECSTSAAYCT